MEDVCQGVNGAMDRICIVIQAKTTRKVVQTLGAGRPRSTVAHQAILNAAGELLDKHGFRAVTMEAIAARAGVSKATIYRHWHNKAAIITERFLQQTASTIGFLHSGPVSEDLRLQMRALARAFSGKSGRVIAALVAEAQDDPTVADALLNHWILIRREDTRRVLQRGMDQGELRANLDLNVVMDALYGPIYYRMLVRHLPLNDDFIDHLADHVLNGLLGGAHHPSIHLMD